MKRAIALLIAFILVVPVMIHVSHAADYWMDMDIGGIYDNYLQPGRIYYFPLMYGNYQLEQGENTGYTVRVSLEPRRNASASIVNLNNLQYVKFSTQVTQDRDEQEYCITLTWTNRSDRYDINDVDYWIEVGYGNVHYAADSELWIYEDQTVIEFADSLNSCFIYLPDGSEFSAALVPNTSSNINKGIGRIINFDSTTDAIYEVESAYGGNAWLEYLRFFNTATFQESLLRIYAPGQSYVYRVRENNTLERLNATKNGDYLVISTTTLDSYVTSNRDLGVSYGTGSTTEAPSTGSSSAGTGVSTAPTPRPSQGTVSYPPNTGGNGYKPNPGTGAK